MLIEMGYKNKLELIDLQDHLALYYEKNGQKDKQIETFYAKLGLMEEIYHSEDKGILKFKKAIASTLVKYHRNKEAVSVLE